MINMNDSGSQAEGCRCYEQLKAINDMKDFSSWAYDSGFYEQLKAMDNMKNSKSWAHVPKGNERF